MEVVECNGFCGRGAVRVLREREREQVEWNLWGEEGEDPGGGGKVSGSVALINYFYFLLPFQFFPLLSNFNLLIKKLYF